LTVIETVLFATDLSWLLLAFAASDLLAPKNRKNRIMSGRWKGRPSVAKRKPIRGWRTYRSVAGKVVKEIDVASDVPGVTIFFRDGTQFYIEVRHPLEFQARTQKMIDGNLVVLHTFPTFKEVKR
jgi:hypothetical protein